MIQDRLFSMTSSLEISSECVEKITQLLLLYILGRVDNYELRSSLEEFDEITKRKIVEFKQDFLDKTYYTLSRYWRAVYCYLKDNEKHCRWCHWFDTCSPLPNGFCSEYQKSPQNIAKEFGITDYDLLLIEMLDVKQLRAVQKDAKNFDFVSHPDSFYYNRMLEVLIPYCQRLVRKRLKFLFVYNNLEASDLVGDLLTHAMACLIELDYGENPKWILNYVKKAIRERAKNMITHFLTDKRARLVPDDELGYAATTFSWENQPRDMGDDEERGIDRIPDETNSVEVIENMDIMKALMDKCNKKQLKVIGAILYKEPKEFFDWLAKKGEENHHKQPLAKNAAEYFEVDWSEVLDIGIKLQELMGVEYGKEALCDR